MMCSITLSLYSTHFSNLIQTIININFLLLLKINIKSTTDHSRNYEIWLLSIITPCDEIK